MVPPIVTPPRSTVTPARPIVALGGPTASGKTALAVALRTRGLPVEVVNFDALQVYRGLDAATAKPSPDEQRLVPMHLLDVVAPDEPMTAGRWAALADGILAGIAARGAWPLLVGGTGLYLRALVRGLAPIPEVPAAVRAAVAQDAARLGDVALHAQLAAVDPAYAAQTPPANRQRVQRALEVWRHTGRAFGDWHAAHRAAPPRHDCRLVVLTPQRPWLHARIDARAAEMAAPLLDEVRALLGRGVDPLAPGLQALGYRDAVAVVRGEASAEALAERLAAAHRAYAKRQQTWFAAEPAALRLDPADCSCGEPAAIDQLAQLLHTLHA